MGYGDLIKILSFYLKCNARIWGAREENRPRANIQAMQGIKLE